jgi:deoxycytidylate deaminase
MNNTQTSHEHWLDLAREMASSATCTDAQCGAVIVADNAVVGRGYNSPPGELESQRRCVRHKDSYHLKVTDKTCCVHAEQRAIMDALRTHPDKLVGSTLYFVRIDAQGAVAPSGAPYCTICSKMALDVGIAYFALVHRDGIRLHTTGEYNTLSYAYQGA